LIIGITQEPSTGDYYFVFYHEIRAVLEKFIQCYKYERHIQYIQYSDFDDLKVIGSGGYGIVYTAKYKYSEEEDINIPETVVLKRFKCFNETPELFINEVSILRHY